MAISAAYPGLDHADPIGTAAAIARGFHAGYPLLEEEVGLLYDLIAIRLVTSVTISARAAATCRTTRISPSAGQSAS